MVSTQCIYIILILVSYRINSEKELVMHRIWLSFTVQNVGVFILILGGIISVSQKTTLTASEWLYHHIDRRTRY